jgi:ketol-acid reductoisomerase
MDQKETIVVVGFGSQAKAWAMNLRDSNCLLKIALQKESKSVNKARDLGFDVITLESKELSSYHTFLVLIPDQEQLKFLEKNHSFITPNSLLVYAHGFSMARDLVHEKYPQFSHALLAPKAIASEVRFQYETKGKIGAAIYSPNKNAESALQALAKKVGFTALYPTPFEKECAADLFSEQSLLCSLIPYGSLLSYNKLREYGISPEVAFMECFLELRSIATAFVNLGPEAFFKLISPNALIGSEKGRKLLINENFQRGLEQIMIDIHNKEFYKEVDVDHAAIRAEVLGQWQKEELSSTFERLKSELI